MDSSGETLYFVDGRFDQSGRLYESDIAVAMEANGEFKRLSNSDEILASVSTDALLEYAVCISADDLDHYYTRVAIPLTASPKPEILVATRLNHHESFLAPLNIESSWALLKR